MRKKRDREGGWQVRLKRDLERCGAKVLNLHGHALQQSGWPDLFVAHAIWSGWIELKRRGKKATPLQLSTIADLRHRRMDALVLRLHQDFHVSVEGPRGVEKSWHEEPSARELLERLRDSRDQRIGHKNL